MIETEIIKIDKALYTDGINNFGIINKHLLNITRQNAALGIVRTMGIIQPWCNENIHWTSTSTEVKHWK